jgi:hypothetical protein
MTQPDPNLFTRSVTGGNAPEYYSQFPADFDISYLVPTTFLLIDFWNDMLTSWADVAQEALNQPIEALVRIREPEVQSTEFKALHAQMMGYDMPASIMTDDAYNRLNRNVGKYIWTQGGDSFIQFLGYVCGQKLSLVRLWTEDYVNFFPGPGKTVFEGGTWYPTTHVGVIVEENPYVADVIPLTDEVLTQKFYEEAPIELVLLWIAEGNTINLGTLYLSMAMVMFTNKMNFYINALYDPNLGLNMAGIGSHKITLSNKAYLPLVNDQMKLGATEFDSIVEHYPVEGVAIIWTNGASISTPYASTPPVTSRRGGTSAWMFTGVGQGQWVGKDILRYNCDPVTGLQIGVLLEPTAFNYVFSSTDFQHGAWETVGNPQPIELGFISMDGSRSVRWFPTTANDALQQTIYLSAGTYTAQLVFRTVNGQPPGFNPELVLLSNSPTTVIKGSIAEIIFRPSVHYASVYGYSWAPLDMSHVLDLGQSGLDDLGGGWQRMKFTFTLTANGQIQINLPINTPIEYFYAGVEDGEVATSFINTGNCAIGVREEDTVLISTDGFLQGSVAMGFVYKGFDNSDSTFTPNETPLTFLDMQGRAIATMTATGETPIDVMTGTVTDYITGKTSQFTEIVGDYPQISFTWNQTKGGNFSLNGNTQSYPNTKMAASLVRIGPGWHGYLTGLVVLPIAVDNPTLDLTLSTTKHPGQLDLGGSFFAGWL